MRRQLNFFRNTSFKHQLIIVVTLGVLLIVALTALGSAWRGASQIRLTLIEQGRRITENLARQAKLALLYDSPENASESVEITLAFPDVAQVEVLRADGRVLISRGKTLQETRAQLTLPQKAYHLAALERETDHSWVFVAPIFSNELAESPFDATERKNELLGYVRIVQTKATAARLMRDVFIVNLGVGLLCVGIFMFGIALLTKRLTRPLTQLSNIMAQAEQGGVSLRAEIGDGPKDIRVMAHAFNSMMEVLEDREDELRRARDDALSLAHLKSHFAATVSHELRTPLNGVVGTLDMLMATPLPERQRHFVEIAWDSAQYLLDLINNVLDFSKLEAGKLELEHIEFDIGDLSEDVIDLLAQQAHQKNLELGYTVATDVPRQVKGDPRRLRQVLINLIGNAIKFTDTGEIALRISADSGSGHHRMLCFEVSDTGIGMNADAQRHIFDSFTQAASSTTRRYSGFGLGLAICKQLVTLMGGSIHVASIAEQGSRFWFTVPLDVAPSSAALPAPTQPIQGRNRRILIVEDSDIVRQFLVQALERWGFHCQIAQTETDAVAALHKAADQGSPFHVAIMDAMFVTSDSGELSGRIRAYAGRYGMRLVLMNRFGADTTVAAHADAYLDKPLHVNRLRKCIFAVLTETRTEQPETSTSVVTETEPNASHKVLVVEDNRANQVIVKGMLEMIGHRCEIARNGQEAMQLFARHDWDLILLDCNMPDMDGYEVASAMRTMEAERGIRTPIVAMTANTQSSDIEKCLVSGMDDHLPKPLTLDRLAEKVTRWVSPHTNVTKQTNIAVVTTNDLDEDSPIDLIAFGKLRDALGETLAQAVSPFLEDMPIHLQEIAHALTNKNADRMRRAAHAVKGSGGTLGARTFAAIAKEIEEHAIAGELTDIHHLVERLNNEYLLVKDALEAELKTSPLVLADETNQGALILVVDDDRSTRSALRHALQRNGFRVVEAEDGAQAVAIASRVTPDVVLMDALMPVMDGFTACAKLQESAQGKDIPVLMITALEDRQSIERAFAAGASDYIPKPIHLTVVNQRVRRIVEATRAERHVRHLAYNDTLTGLPNRVLFVEYLNQTITRAANSSQSLAVLFLDLDRFKFVNDTLGHEIGDRLLKSVALRIKHCIRSGDCVARLGGDEFTIVLDELPNPAAASNTAQKICRSLAAPFEIDGHDIFVSASIGIALFPNDGNDVSTLLRRADTAMYRAKNNNSSYAFYEAGMEATVSHHLRMENALRRALEREELIVYYQPIAKTETNTLTGMETLVRWRHPSRGIVSPTEFIPIAEETGIIIPIGEWVLRAACKQAKEWLSNDTSNLRVTVNLSGSQLKQSNFAEIVERILSETGLNPSNLTLEITESVLMEHARETISMLHRLKEIGLNLAIDDFGTGYSSLAYLKRFPVDLLKIDRGFTREMTTNNDDASIVTGIIALAHSLRLEVVAEGVEHKAQRDFLTGLGCDYMQGYYLSEPLPADQFKDRILLPKTSNVLHLPTRR